jgi:hypothetical protein
MYVYRKHILYYSNADILTASSFHTSKPSPKSKYSLCNECQEKQELKLKELCNYIPDENVWKWFMIKVELLFTKRRIGPKLQEEM